MKKELTSDGTSAHLVCLVIVLLKYYVGVEERELCRGRRRFLPLSPGGGGSLLTATRQHILLCTAFTHFDAQGAHDSTKYTSNDGAYTMIHDIGHFTW